MKFVLCVFIFVLVKLGKCDNFVLEITTNNISGLALPSLANGNLGLVVYGDAILINGVYNGLKGQSHRARVPNYANIRFEHCGTATNSAGSTCKYSLNMQQGVFRTSSPFSLNYFSVEQETYVHRYYTQTIVNRIRITRPVVSANASQFAIYQVPGVASVDLTFDAAETITTFDKTLTLLRGRTRQVEDPVYQSAVRDVFVLYENVRQNLEISTSAQEVEYVHLTVVGMTREEVLEEYRNVAAIPYAMLYERHTYQWTSFWDESAIDVQGNDELAQVVYASQFALTSSLPSKRAFTPNKPFYGLSPSGLPKGGILYSDYQGHSFWDTEMWMHPPILLLNPSWSKDLLHYRYLVRKAAADNANATGYAGLRFPWESAYTGREVTPDCCPETVEFQQHIVADIAFAVKSHLFMTHDLEWFKEEGCLLAYQTAQFWESRVSYDSSTGLYDIKGIMGPDEDNYNISNNAYTNVNAGYNLYFGEFADCVCSQWYPELYKKSDRFSKIARNIKLIHDTKNNYIPQFEGYSFGTVIKQADTILVSYPLQYPLDATVRKNNLRIYENVTRADGPAMTWSMFVINNLDVGVFNETLFKRSYEPYVRKPFNVWNEAIITTPGAENFITGAGGFLQMMINGFGGLRLHNDYIQFSTPVSLPSQTTKIMYRRLHYLGAEFEVERWAKSTTITFKKLGTHKIHINAPHFNSTYLAELNVNYILSENQTMTMQPATSAFNQCSLPGYRIGAGSSLRPLVGFIVALIIIRLLNYLF